MSNTSAFELSTITFPEDLPVSQHREQIMEQISTHQVVIVAGETGSGKTTQLPKMCLALGLADTGMIGHTHHVALPRVPWLSASQTSSARISGPLLAIRYVLLPRCRKILS